MVAWCWLECITAWWGSECPCMDKSPCWRADEPEEDGSEHCHAGGKCSYCYCFYLPQPTIDLEIRDANDVLCLSMGIEDGDLEVHWQVEEKKPVCMQVNTLFRHKPKIILDQIYPNSIQSTEQSIGCFHRNIDRSRDAKNDVLWLSMGIEDGAHVGALAG